jgi:mono/diheme cytochrome c family protein
MMKSILALSALAAFGASGSVLAAADPALVARGEYLAHAGDCMACHTVPGGKPYAGGLGIKSPLGTIYATNITPDAKAGIGGYTLEQFSRAMREGVRADGARLYPAMPYTAFSKVGDADIAALYAYFMNGVAPVAEKAPETSLTWPFSMRWGLAMWNGMFAPSPKAVAAAEGGDPVARGRYLVEGLGHCGSCHTDRGLAMQERAYDGSSADFLSGADVNGWHAPNLRAGGEGRGIQAWSDADIAEYLATGRNLHNAVVGEMSLVVEHSTSRLTDADVAAIAAFLKSLPGPRAATKAAGSDTEAKLAAGVVGVDSGERLYLDNCAACHFVTGMGAPRVFPSLRDNSLVVAKDPTGLLSVILAGARMPSTAKAPADLAMPGFAARLSDEEAAKIATFVRSGWGNTAPAVSAKEAAAVRRSLAAPR